MQQHDERVASAVRAELARRRRPQADLAAVLQLGRGAMQRRLAGEVPFTAGELHATAQFLNLPLSALIDDPAVPA